MRALKVARLDELPAVHDVDPVAATQGEPGTGRPAPRADGPCHLAHRPAASPGPAPGRRSPRPVATAAARRAGRAALAAPARRASCPPRALAVTASSPPARARRSR